MALIIGIYQILFAIFQLGGLVNFVPYPVLTGFSSGVAVIIFVSQLGKLLGIEGEVGHGLFGLLENIYLQFDYIDLIAITIGVTTILMITVLRKINKNIPAALIAITICSYFTYLFELNIAPTTLHQQLLRVKPNSLAIFLPCKVFEVPRFVSL